MTAKQELLQFLSEHGDNPRVLAALLDMADFEGKTLIDVGTGAGFPGLPLKILCPSLSVTLLDSLGKRVNWLNEVAGQLELQQVSAIHARAEEQAQIKGFRDGFDFATARAVFSRISSGVPFIIQLPPQAMILSFARYSHTLSSEMPPVGRKRTAGNAAESALIVPSPP